MTTAFDNASFLKRLNSHVDQLKKLRNQRNWAIGFAIAGAAGSIVLTILIYNKNKKMLSLLNQAVQQNQDKTAGALDRPPANPNQ